MAHVVEPQEIAEREKVVVNERREALLSALTHAFSPDGPPPDHPLSAYLYLYGKKPDKTVEMRVIRHCTRFGINKPGYIYVFQDPNLSNKAWVKIGGTEQTVAQRLRQWKDELRTPNLQLLFSVHTHSWLTVENIIKAVYTNERIRTLYNRHTGRELTEFYHIDDLNSLAAFINTVARYGYYQFIRSRDQR